MEGPRSNVKQLFIGLAMGIVVGSAITSNYRAFASLAAPGAVELKQELERTAQQLSSALLELNRMKSESTRPLELESAPGKEGSHSSGADAPWRAIVEEIMPPSLHARYASHHMPFDVTWSMLRRSRPIVGNTERLHLYLRKLHSRQCTTVLYMGGSVTHGRAAKNESHAYPSLFVDYLNERYPCAINGTAMPGRHTHHITDARDSLGHFTAWARVAEVEAFDLVFLEFNINDFELGGLPHALESKRPGGKTGGYSQNWYFETLLRRLLLLRTPDPVAVVTFNADFDGRQWTPSPDHTAEAQRGRLFRHNEPMSMYVSSLYEVPVFSLVLWYIPLSRRKGTDWMFDENNAYSAQNFHADSCCHPHREGHLLLSLILAYCLHEEDLYLSGRDPGTVLGELDDLTTGEKAILPDPIYLSPEEDEAYVTGNLSSYGHSFDFSDTRKQWDEKHAIVANDGWTWYADTHGKFGFICDDVKGGPHLAIALTGGRFGKVEVTYIASYENFGVALAWVDEFNDNIHEKCVMNGEFTQQTPKVADFLWAKWGKKVSVPQTELLQRTGLGAGEKKVLHICLTPQLPNERGGNKFKLVGVRSY